MKLKATKGTIGLLAGLLALTVIALGFVFWLQRGAVDRTMRSLRDKEAQLNDGQQMAGRREAATTALEEDRAQLRFLESGVSNAAFVPTLLKQLEELAGSTHNKVLGVRPELIKEAPSRLEQRRDPDAKGKEKKGDDEAEKKRREPYTRLSIQVSLVGGFKSTQLFVERLMRFPKIVAVEELQIKPHKADRDDEGSGSALLDVEIKLTAFVMKEDAPAAPPSGGTVATNAGIGGI
jgi:Tfp pilus assembly protein PilO